MKRGSLLAIGLLSILFISLLSFNFVSAATNSTNSSVNVSVTGSDSTSKVDLAYQCLQNKVDNKCSSLSLEEKIFTTLAINECKSSLIDDSDNKKCWPKGDCNIKSTAQAILALSQTGEDTKKAEDWLLSQNTTPTGVEWLLQVESNKATTCTATYSGTTNSFSISEDKKISSSAGSCLIKDSTGYWLRVSPNCYDVKFDISCSESFLTSLLYKKSASQTIYVSETTNSASAEGTINEEISSQCFKNGNTCDYEGSLWAAMVLDSRGHDISSYLPYLITTAEDNEKFFPDSFLYALTGFPDFRADLLLKQKGQFWDESGDKFYDTALALLPLQFDQSAEKSNAQNWLLDVQDSNGCWKGNIRNTAFILYSGWPKDFNEGSSNLDCEGEGFYCMSAVNCVGQVLDQYSCSGVSRCCSQPIAVPTCLQQGGEICNSNQICLGGINSASSDSVGGETCCVGGSCGLPQKQNECEQNSGTCRTTTSCQTTETQSSFACEVSSDICCIKGLEPPKKGSLLWLWIILIILILLIVIGIIYRDRLRPYWYRIKSKFTKDKSKGSSGRFSGPPRDSPSSPSINPPLMRPSFRPLNLPSGNLNQRPLPPSRAAKKKPSDFDDVLKKLKDMSK